MDKLNKKLDNLSKYVQELSVMMIQFSAVMGDVHDTVKDMRKHVDAIENKSVEDDKAE